VVNAIGYRVQQTMCQPTLYELRCADKEMVGAVQCILEIRSGRNLDRV
jgi:hypothetical protein